MVRARLRVATLAAAVALLGAPFACKRAEPPAPEATAKADSDISLSATLLDAGGVRSGKPRRVPLRSFATLAGTVEFVPNRVARVGPLIEGRVTSIKVDPGARVDKGALLATVESVEIGRARADYLSSQVKVEFAAKERERQRRLADGGLTSGQSLLAAETQTDLALLEKRAAAERLSAVGIRAEDLNAAFEGGASRPSTATVLRTPIGGLVLDVNARIGQAVSATDTLFVVGEIDRVWLVVDVYERDLARVRVGDEAKARVIAYPEREFRGKVDYVGGTVDQTKKAVSARIVLENADGVLRPGMSAAARVFGAPPAGDAGLRTVLVVPRDAVQTIDGQPFVFLEKGAGKFDLRPVVRGEEIDGDVEITRGLKDDEPIAVDGTFVLKSEALRAQMGAND